MSFIAFLWVCALKVKIDSKFAFLKGLALGSSHFPAFHAVGQCTKTFAQLCLAMYVSSMYMYIFIYF